MKLNVAVTVRISPDGVETDLSKIESALSEIAKKYGQLHSSEIKPIAFGLKCVEAAFLMDDSMGGIDELEADLRKLPGASEVDVIDINRL